MITLFNYDTHLNGTISNMNTKRAYSSKFGTLHSINIHKPGRPTAT